MALISFKDTPKQAEFVFSQSKLTAYFGKIRGGKTVGGCARCLMFADLYPGNEILVGRKTYPDLWNTTGKELLAMVAKRNGGTLNPGPYLLKWIQSNSGPDFQTLVIKTKGEPSKIRLRYADDVGSMLGGEWGAFFLDQIEEIDEDVYSQVVNRLTYWNVNRINEFVAKYKYKPKSFGFVTGNPDPGWAHEEFKINAKGKYHFIETTIEENSANLPPGYFDDLARDNPPSWVARFLHNDWSVKAGQIYKEFDERIHVIEPFEIPAHWSRYIAMDYGFSHPTAVYWGAVDEKGIFYIYREYFKSGVIASQIAQEIKRMSVGDPVPMLGDHILVYMPPDMNKHDGIVTRTVQQEFGLYGIQGLPANNEVEAGILKIQERLHRNSLKIFRGACPALVKGLKTYARDEATGKPIKKDDDSADSARYLVLSALENRSDTPTPTISLDEYSLYVVGSELNKLGETGFPE
jgi:phage terminase large subunit